MLELLIYLVKYKGQTESAYEWHTPDPDGAERLLAAQRQQYPDREWYIIEKDVS